PKATETPRRKFLQGAALAATGAATLGFPMVAKAQGPISMRWQSTWPSKDIFHEYALDYAKKVNDMTGGDLKIEVLPAGAGGPAFGLLDAVSKGVLDGGHGGLGYHYGKQTALGPLGAGRAGLSLRQADGAGAVGLGPGLCDGRQHAARLAPLWRRQGAAGKTL